MGEPEISGSFRCFWSACEETGGPVQVQDLPVTELQRQSGFVCWEPVSWSQPAWTFSLLWKILSLDHVQALGVGPVRLKSPSSWVPLQQGPRGLLPLELWGPDSCVPVSPSAHVPGGAVEGAGEPRKHSGGSSGCRAAGEELPDLQRPRCQDAVPAAVAGYRC